jgi:hypothetical protein
MDGSPVVEVKDSSAIVARNRPNRTDVRLPEFAQLPHRNNSPGVLRIGDGGSTIADSVLVVTTCRELLTVSPGRGEMRLFRGAHG